MPEIKDLTTKIQDTWEQMKAKNDSIIEESKGTVKKVEEWRAEDRAEITKMNDALDGLKEKLDKISMDNERAKLVLPGEERQLSDEQKFRKSAFMKYMREGRAAMSPDEKKALVQDTSGLYLVPEDMEAEIMRAVAQINTIRNYCRVRNTSRNAVKVNSISEVSVGWGKLETGTDITESTMTPTQDTIYVEDLYGLTKVGEDELSDTDANIQAIIADSFAVAIANAEAKAFAVGTGHTTYSQPDGVAVDATIIASYKTNWTTADTAIPDDMLKAEYYLPSQYKNGAAWLMHSKTELELRLYKEAVASGYYGNYMWAPGLAGAPNTFDTYPVIRQDDMNYADDATKGINVIFGNFKLGYMIVDRAGIGIQRLDELYAEAGLVGFKVHKRVGGGVYRPAAFWGLYNNT
ncbi:MAG: phage major capsid protein [Dehalococcoidales bacterium]|nr:phage major capsid protein [Dehalococcoidales bacterium]